MSFLLLGCATNDVVQETPIQSVEQQNEAPTKENKEISEEQVVMLKVIGMT